MEFQKIMLCIERNNEITRKITCKKYQILRFFLNIYENNYERINWFGKFYGWFDIRRKRIAIMKFLINKCAIYWQNIQYGWRMGIKSDKYRKYIVLIVTMMNNLEIQAICEHINWLVKYWTTDINKSIGKI